MARRLLWSTEQIPLRQISTVLGNPVPLADGFHTFDDSDDIQLLGELEKFSCNATLIEITIDVPDQIHVEFDKRWPQQR